jgi:arylsulfatase A-like enzyme
MTSLRNAGAGSRIRRILAAAVGVAGVAAVLSGAPADRARPNVLMIALDDLNDWVGHLGGHPDVRTPHLDALARRGLAFTNAHVAAPVCNPSRVTLMTGRNPASTGIYGNEVRWHEVLPGIASLPAHFKANGYRVAGGGKINHHTPGFNRRSDWHVYFDQVFDSHYQARLAAGEDMRSFAWPSGFPLNGLPEVRSFSRPPQNANEFDWGPWDQGDDEMGDGRLATWIAEFLARPPPEPFFLAAGIYRPHLPWYAPRKYFEIYPKDRIWLPPVKEDDLDDIPAGGQRMAADRRGDLDLVRRAGQYRDVLQAYLANITYGDALVGKIIAALDASPAAANTIVVLWREEPPAQVHALGAVHAHSVHRHCAGRDASRNPDGASGGPGRPVPHAQRTVRPPAGGRP